MGLGSVSVPETGRETKTHSLQGVGVPGRVLAEEYKDWSASQVLTGNNGNNGSHGRPVGSARGPV